MEELQNMQGINNSINNDNLEKSVGSNKQFTISNDSKEFKEIVSAATDLIKKEFLTILGTFAALITFVSVQVQIFAKIGGVYNLLGISSFTLGGLLLFAITLHGLSTKDFEWYKNIAVWLCLVFLVASFFFLNNQEKVSQSNKEFIQIQP